MNSVTVPYDLLNHLYELALHAEYDDASGLCHQCGHAVSPAYNETHQDDCQWLVTINEIEHLIDNAT